MLAGVGSDVTQSVDPDEIQMEGQGDPSWLSEDPRERMAGRRQWLYETLAEQPVLSFSEIPRRLRKTVQDTTDRYLKVLLETGNIVDDQATKEGGLASHLFAYARDDIEEYVRDYYSLSEAQREHGTGSIYADNSDDIVRNSEEHLFEKISKWVGWGDKFSDDDSLEATDAGVVLQFKKYNIPLPPTKMRRNWTIDRTISTEDKSLSVRYHKSEHNENEMMVSVKFLVPCDEHPTVWDAWRDKDWLTLGEYV